MLTKGIIEDVKDLKDIEGSNYTSEEPSNVFYYKVRIPIIHGYSNSPGCVPTRRLPDSCIYAGLPGEQTVLHKGDMVLVEFSDYDPQWPVILGLIPHVPDDFVDDDPKAKRRGYDKTNSGLSIKNVQDITFDVEDGHTLLPKETYIQTDNEYYGKDKVDGKELGQLKGVEAPIQLQLDDLSQSITSVLSSLSSTEVWVKSDDITIKHTIVVSEDRAETVDGVEYRKKLDKVRSSLWMDNSHKNILNFNYVFRYVGENNWVFPSDDPVQTITKSELASYGINYDTVPSTGDLFYVAITMGVIPIEMGGTGADNVIQAREHLEVLKDVLISETEFDNLQESDYKTNTIYYIYEET